MFSILRALIEVIDVAVFMLLDKVAFFNEDSYKVSACGFRHARPFCNIIPLELKVSVTQMVL